MAPLFLAKLSFRLKKIAFLKNKHVGKAKCISCILNRNDTESTLPQKLFY